MPQRLLLELKEDLNLWLEVLILSNGVLFFNNKERPRFYLFTNTLLLKGYRGFYFSGENSYQPNYAASLPQAQAFSYYPLLDQVDNYINLKEIYAITKAFRKQLSVWRYRSLYIYIDNIVTYSSIQNNIIKGSRN